MKLKLTWFMTLFMAFVMQFSFAQEKTVTGTVTSAEDGLPLPGVSVIVKGTSRGVQTDFDGNYAIKVSANETLVFSYVGTKKTEKVVGSSSTLNVAMVEDIGALDEVVVVAYGTQKRAQITGSVATVTAEDIEGMPLGSFDQMLKGQAPGLLVSSGSGQPGASASVVIRGASSITGSSQPLYILDGVPINGADFATLNSNDFESVSVLKDAITTALYGSRGTNGVIVITTKKGRAGRSRVQYSTQYGFSEAGDPRFNLMNGSEKRIFENLQTPGRWTDLEVATAPTTNWEDIFFRRGTTKTHNFSVSGGDEKTTFFTSASYFDQEGIAIRSNLQRMTARLNLDHKVSEKFKVGVNSSIGFSKSNFISAENGVNLNNPFAATYLAQPYDTPYNDDGSYRTGPSFVGGNALENLENNINKQNDIKINVSAYASLELLKNVTARISAGVDYVDRKIETGASPETYFGQNAGFTGDQGGYSFANQFIANINSTTSLNYTNTFNDVHSVSATAFIEYVKFHSQGANFQGFGINPKLVGYATGVTPGTDENGFIPTVGGSVTERGLFGAFMNLQYSYDDRYFVEASVRRDASSRFSDSEKWGTFPAIGIGWAIHNEAFFNASWVNNLKLRGSYGITGNQLGIGDFQNESTYGTTSYAGIAGIVVSGLGNEQLKWEETATFDVGLDFGFFNNRIRGSVDYYKAVVSDAFIDQQLSATSGFGSLDVNSGEMQNVGFDGQIDATVLQTKDFSWSVNFNFNHNKNEVTDLGQEDEFEQGTSIIREGLPIGSHYAVGWAGVNPANGQPLYLDGEGNVTDVFSADNSLAQWGSFNPVLTGGFGSQIDYKGFNLSAQFTFVDDYFRFNNQTFFQENPNFSQFNLSTQLLDIWTTPGQVTDIQGFNYNRQFSSKDIEDASYLRFTNVTLGYNFSAAALDNIDFFSGIRVYVQGQNLYTWTNFSGFDPEDDNNIAQYEYPTPRTFTFGVDLNF